MDVRLYYQTGFNAVNIPDTPSLLDGGIFTYADFPSIDILQERFLSSVRIRGTWGNVKNADYCRIVDTSDNYVFYYIIDGIRMHAVDVAEILLIPDYVTSAGGLENLQILDGVATRCHVDDDTYGAWSLDDEYLTPSEPLVIDTARIVFSGNSMDVVESSIDLGLMATVGCGVDYESVTGETVTTPKSYTNFAETTYTMDGNTVQNMRTTVFPLSSSHGIIRDGIEQCRALGIESAVVNTARIPTTLVTGTTGTESVMYSSTAGEYSNFYFPTTSQSYTRTLEVGTNTYDSSLNETWDLYTDLEGVFTTSDSGLLFEYDTSVKNKRVLYGKTSKVGLLTTAGNRLETEPENITGGSNTTIQIKSVGDPHTNGCPYHRFLYMNGDSSNTGFWLNAIKGLQWKQIPLIYTQKSGSVLDRVSFENSREVADLNYKSSSAGILDSVGNGIANGLGLGNSWGNTISDAIAGVGGALAGGMLGGGVGALAGGLGAGVAQETTRQKYQLAKQQEQQQFAISQNVVAPSISVDYDGEAFRDFYGECVIVYRYRPTATDLARMDKILTMYGYRVNVPAPSAPLHNRDYFNYIQANITVGGNLPRWMADGVAMQVSNGIRLWHVQPNVSHYNNNPIT